MTNLRRRKEPATAKREAVAVCILWRGGRFVQLSIEQSSKTVGPPINELRITGEGYRWISKDECCQESLADAFSTTSKQGNSNTAFSPRESKVTPLSDLATIATRSSQAPLSARNLIQHAANRKI